MTLENCIGLSILIFCIGIYGLLTRRNLIGILLSIELMLNSANINFIAFAYFKAEDPMAGSIFTVFVMAITACELSVALAIIISMYRQRKQNDIHTLEELYG
jgi:NADH:ubiquinone oxidoreductase subunit K